MSWTQQDPGQGDPDGIDVLAMQLGDVADSAYSAQGRLQKLKDNASDAIWRGTSADAFRDRIDKLPGHLQQLADSYKDASDGFSGYAASVRQIKHEATLVQNEIANAQSAKTSAVHQQGQYVAPDGATSTVNPYDQAVANAQGQLSNATSKLAGLADDRSAADSKVKAALKQAHDVGMKNKSGWVHFWESVAKVLAVIAIVLIVIAVIAVCIALPEIAIAFLAADGLIAGLGAAGATAATAAFGAGAFGLTVGTAMAWVGGASLATEGVLAASGEGSWNHVALDAALMFGPGLLLKSGAYVNDARLALREGDDVVQLVSGSKGAWTTDLNLPRPNTTYVVDGKFVYATDDAGRVYKSSATLDDLIAGERNGYQQRVSGRADRLPTDQGGHIYGTQFGGPGEAINLTAMRADLNSTGLREYYQMEQQWAGAIKDGKSVDVTVEIEYAAGSARPEGYDVTYTIDGKTMTQFFEN